MGGLVLASIVFMLMLPRVQRWKAIAVGLPVILSGVIWTASQRLGDSVRSSGWFASFFDDVGAGSNFAAIGGRELELRLGMNAFLNSPIFGNGTWARYYDGYVRIDWQMGPVAFLWTHSSVLHIAFKTGISGSPWLARCSSPFSSGSSSIKKTYLCNGAAFTWPDWLACCFSCRHLPMPRRSSSIEQCN